LLIVTDAKNAGTSTGGVRQCKKETKKKKKKIKTDP